MCTDRDSAPTADDAKRAGLLWRRVFLVLLVVATWIAAARFLGNRGEAFWLLFPLWIFAGVKFLRAIPMPRPQYQHPFARWAVRVVLVVIPVGYCFGMAHFMGAAVHWREVLLAIWFFAASLEILLLYLFHGFDALRIRLERGRGRVGRVAALAGTKVALYSVLVMVLIPVLSIHRVKFSSCPPPPDSGMVVEEVRFHARNDPQTRLAGWFFPLRENRGTVLACHGVGANRADILEYVWILRDAGYQVFCFDFRGHGDSDGHTVTYGAREKQDVMGAWDYLIARRDVDPANIYGFGLSMGASSLLMSLSDLPGIRAVVADSPFSSLDHMVRHQYRFVPGALAEIPVAFTRMVGWADAGLRLDQSDAAAAIRGLRTPIFFIHGLEDATIPPECSRILFEQYGGPKKLRLEPGAGHGGTAPFDVVRYGDELSAFFTAAAPGSTHAR